MRWRIIGLVALVFLGACSQPLSDATRATPDTTASAVPTSSQRDEAIALVTRRDEVGRVDRTDAKLMTFAEYLRIAGPVRTHGGNPQATAVTGFGIIGDPATRDVWAVAVSGEVWPNGRIPIYWGGAPPASPTPYPSYRWAIFLVESVPGRLMTIADAGIAESWPAVFDQLPNHPMTAYVQPNPTPTLSSLAVGIHEAEATTAVMRAGSEVRRIDRIEATLMTWREYVAGDPLLQKPTEADAGAPIWVVAVSGEIVPQLGRGVTATWGVFVIDALTGSIESLTAGSNGAWPTFFDALPDHPTASR